MTAPASGSAGGATPTEGPWEWHRGTLFAVHADGRRGSRAIILNAQIRGQQCHSDDVYVSVRKQDAPFIAIVPELHRAAVFLASLTDEGFDAEGVAELEAARAALRRANGDKS